MTGHPRVPPVVETPMTPTEAAVAAVVVTRAKSAQHDERSAYWLWPDREEIAPIPGVGDSWPAIWAQTHVIYLD